MRLQGLVLLLVASACGVIPEPGLEPAVARQAVIGGVPERGSPAVGGIVPVAPTCGEPVEAAAVTCTGTLIAPRVVLTAAHCVENADAPQVLSVVFAAESAGALASERVRTVDGWLHPDWRAGENDIGVLVLAEDAPVTPVPLDGVALPADLVGRTTRVVGFGLDEQGRIGGRRSGTARVTAVGEGTFSIEAAPGMTCGGDSGGPSFLEVDGAERLVGITSFGDLACTRGTNTRVDVHAPLLRALLEEIARAPPTRMPIDPAMDACSARCEVHADCPLGMACVTRPGGGKSCAAAGLEAGRFGAVCTGPEGERLCVRAGESCRLWLPCTEEDEGGCAAAGSTSGWMWTLAVLLILIAGPGPMLTRGKSKRSSAGCCSRRARPRIRWSLPRLRPSRGPPVPREGPWQRLTVDQAASAVREFKPKVVYPYHSRNSDVNRCGRRSAPEHLVLSGPTVSRVTPAHRWRGRRLRAR